MICYYLFKTAKGEAGFALSPAGIRQVILPGLKPARIREQLAEALDEVASGGFPPPPLAQRFVEEAKAYFEGQPAAFDLPVDLPEASAFELKVYRALQKVGYGQVRSYGWLAEKVGAPAGARAVGAALAKNPVPLIVPCHRIVRADGSLGGFSAAGGARLKQWMLKLEAKKKE
jgi:methylated-DNA-[protein]-cysteine S-methyltransferase